MVKELAEHGTTRRYRQGCHCQPCKTANAEKSAAQREVYRITAAVDPAAVPEHGTLTAYAQWGCRCDPCVEHSRAYDRDRRARAKAARQMAEKVLTFTGATIPGELVAILDADAGKAHSADGGVRASLARILNAYEQWRHEQIIVRKDQADGSKDA